MYFDESRISCQNYVWWSNICRIAKFGKYILTIVCDYFKSDRSRWGELILGSPNNTPDETNGVNNAVSCYKEAVQFSASFVTSLFASFFDEICETAMSFVFYRPSNTIN